MPRAATVVLTIGHSTRAFEDFLTLLRVHAVAKLVDVRTLPGSRHNPQFNRDILQDALKGQGISYLHMPGLGGLRQPNPDSPNAGWRNSSFRGYADYMQTEEFERNLEDLIRSAGRERSALMCAEAVPWRCHRSLIADALVSRGVGVEHILGMNRSQPHSLTPFAQVEGKRLTYPPSPSQMELEMGE